MTVKNIFTSIIAVSVLSIFCSFSAKATDCSISINTKASVKCLQRKVSSLEARLEKTKKDQLVLPKGAVIDFNAKTCPVGWGKFKKDKSGIISINTNDEIIKCEKL